MNLVACIMRKVECESESVVAKIWKYDKYEKLKIKKREKKMSGEEAIDL